MKTFGIVVALFSIASVGWAKQQPVRIAPLFVYDANGKRVAVVLDMPAPPGQATVSLRVNGIGTTAVVGRNTFIVGLFPLLFESADCTGTPFVEDMPNSLFENPLTTAPPGLTVYGSQTGASSQTITIGSEIFGDSACAPPPPRTNPVVQAFPAVPLVNLNTLFTPPFTIR